MTDLRLDFVNFRAAKFACLHWHYSKCMPVGKLVKVGVWEYGKYIGVVIFGRGANKSLGSKFGLEQDRICELVRVALNKHQVPVSRVLMIAIKFLKQTSPNLKLIVSFADISKGHHGGIYQATNWIYNGKTKCADEYFYKNKLWHGRAFRKSHGSHLNYINKGLKIVKGSSKHRYLMPLTKEMKIKLNKLKQKYPLRVSNDRTAEPIAERQFDSDPHAPN